MRKQVFQTAGLLCLLGVVFLPAVLRADDDRPRGHFSVKELKDEESRVEQLVDQVMACTVCVRSANGSGSGSGVIVNEQGLVLTAAHVTQAAGADLIIIFPDGKEVKAKSLGANIGRDAGMAQITEGGKYPFAKPGKSADLSPNQWCVALGHAGGFDPSRTPPVRLGRVLNNGRFVSTDCTLIGGDSGGPLFDIEGRVIGIHSNIGQSLSQNNHVPIDVFHADWKRMQDGELFGRPQGNGDPNRPMLGIQLSPHDVDNGVLIDGVSPESPAAKAGIQAGDIVQQVDGKEVRTPQQLVERVGKRKVGQTVKLQILRGEKEMEFNAKLVRASTLSGEPDEKEGDKKDDDKADEKEEGDENEDKSDDDFNFEELLRRARKSGGRIELKPEQMKRFQAELAKRGMEIGGGRNPSAKELNEWAKNVFKSYEPVVKKVTSSVLGVYVEDKHVALATVVSKDGRLLTKASEIAGKEFSIEISDEKLVKGEVVKTFDDYDLALIQIDAKDLIAVEFSQNADDLDLGTFVAAVGGSGQPEAIGVVSVMPRNLHAARQGYLGVSLEKVDGGIRLMQVAPNSPADKGGLKPGDVVTKVEGKTYPTPAGFAKAIAGFEPGEEIKMKVRRGDDDVDVTVELGDRRALANMPGRQGRMNELGGPLSTRRTGFRMAIQHDCPIDPNDCGGPLVDLDGDVLGINIARAGRIKSYAVPSETILKLLAEK
jgi:serine protease Do